jgi:hypothetical protein
MRYIGIVPFVGFAAAFGYVLRSDMQPALKKKVFRWSPILSALSLLIVMPLTGIEIGLMIFVVPVLAVITFLIIKYIKICERRGAAVQVNLPFIDQEHCPECGSDFNRQRGWLIPGSAVTPGLKCALSGSTVWA